MHTKAILLMLLAGFALAGTAAACDQVSYAGCSAEQLRAIQQQQFLARKSQPADAAAYWRDRQYADRVRLEERNHQLELERLRSQTEIEVARQESRAWRRHGYYFYQPPVVVRPEPVPPPLEPRPYLRGAVYSNSSPKRVPMTSK